MLPDRVSNPGLLTYESGALPIALRGPALYSYTASVFMGILTKNNKSRDMKVSVSVHGYDLFLLTTTTFP